MYHAAATSKSAATTLPITIPIITPVESLPLSDGVSFEVGGVVLFPRNTSRDVEEATEDAVVDAGAGRTLRSEAWCKTCTALKTAVPGGANPMVELESPEE
jgi:hypothetical protein